MVKMPASLFVYVAVLKTSRLHAETHFGVQARYRLSLD
jgi:hypothetical protein